MNVQDWALAGAGGLGAGVAVVHGALVQRYLVEPVEEANPRFPPTQQRLLVAVVHFSTINWFLCGLALIASALWLSEPARAPLVVLVASAYAYAAAGNLWCTRRLHPGWILYALCLGLIWFSYHST